MALDAYPDSSFLFSLVAKDSHTPEASRFLVETAAPLIFTPLHRTEVRNALRDAAARKEITQEECRSAFWMIENDLREEILVHMPINWSNALRRADELSERHASERAQRTIDLLHVAIACEAGASTFLSFDQRQRKLANAAGLKVKP